MKARAHRKFFSRSRGQHALDAAAKRAVKGLKFEALEGRTLLSSYVVSTTVSDANAGTAASPWKTLQKAADTVKAGDTVTVNAGDYEGFSAYTLRGTAAAPIKFSANG